jgi:hypothetical protein
VVAKDFTFPITSSSASKIPQTSKMIPWKTHGKIAHRPMIAPADFK